MEGARPSDGRNPSLETTNRPHPNIRHDVNTLAHGLPATVLPTVGNRRTLSGRSIGRAFDVRRAKSMPERDKTADRARSLWACPPSMYFVPKRCDATLVYNRQAQEYVTVRVDNDNETAPPQDWKMLAEQGVRQNRLSNWTDVAASESSA